MNEDDWKEVERFQRRADEAAELFDRVPRAFPLRANALALRTRWDARDPNVVKVDSGEDGITYHLEFTESQQNELKRAYLAARPKTAVRSADGLEFEASVFVGILESWGSSIAEYAPPAPPSQKERKRAFESLSTSVTKVDQALSVMDSAALGYLYAHVVDELAPLGLQLSTADNEMATMTSHPLRAMVEAGELRHSLRAFITAIVTAADKASASLPKHDHVENDKRLGMARQLERQMCEHNIQFTSVETGPAAFFLRAVFSLGGLDVEKVSYWLKKVEDDPDNHTRFLARMRGEA